MKRLILHVAMSVALLGGYAGMGFAQGAEEQELHTVGQHLDQEAAGKAKASHVEALSQQFKVEPAVVENLRASKQGWGEITIRLGIAEALMKASPETYQDMPTALQKVEDLRAQKMGWGGIAKSLGFKLGSVVSEVKHVRNELRKAERVEGGAKAEKVKHKDTDEARLDRGTKGDKLDKIEKIDKVEKMEKMEKVERPERVERVEKMERPEKPDRIK